MCNQLGIPRFLPVFLAFGLLPLTLIVCVFVVVCVGECPVALSTLSKRSCADSCFFLLFSFFRLLFRFSKACATFGSENFQSAAICFAIALILAVLLFSFSFAVVVVVCCVCSIGSSVCGLCEEEGRDREERDETETGVCVDAAGREGNMGNRALTDCACAACGCARGCACACACACVSVGGCCPRIAPAMAAATRSEGEARTAVWGRTTGAKSRAASDNRVKEGERDGVTG